MQAIIISLTDTLTARLEMDSSNAILMANPSICDFKVDLVSNSQTRVEVIRKGLDVKAIPHISDSIFIYYQNKRQYVHPDKNIFRRIFSWDWKKKTTTSHVLHHTNDLFNFDDILFIEIINEK